MTAKLSEHNTGKKRLGLILSISALCLIAASLYLKWYSIAKAGIVKQETVVFLSTAAPYRVLLDSLTSGDKIFDIRSFDSAARLLKMRNGEVKAGRYVLARGMSALQMARMFRNGSQFPVNVTFNNIRTMQDLAGKLGIQLRADSAALATLLTDDITAAKYGFDSRNFIAMFIPDTYQLYWTISPEGLFDRMKKEYERFWDKRSGGLERTGLTRGEVSTLASIIDEETNKGDEMATMAGVYINRLRAGMPLQADPTVKFALGDMTLKRILHKYLEVDSPYNTYKNRGLPPGPIRMPSTQAIDAVLNYREHDYYYFCASPDFSGYHVFARTLDEHNVNARKYAKALSRAGIR